jgi:hypothetical protein
MTLSDFSSYISIVSGFMTIAGISGVISWSIFERSQNRVARSVLLILAYSLKTALCCALFIPFLWAWRTIYVFAFRYLGDGTFSYVHPYWDDTAPIANTLAYIASVGLLFPTYAISAACIYRFSFAPIAELVAAMKSKSDSEKGPLQSN